MKFSRRRRNIMLGLAAGAAGWVDPRSEGGRTDMTIRRRYAVSDHCDGDKFFNLGDAGVPRIWSLIKWQFERQSGPWPQWVDAAPGPRPPERVGAGKLRVTWVNHTTFLLQFDNLNVLTDPIWSERCSPVAFAGPKRVRPPGLNFDDLPPIDLILLSHNHYDHCDTPTLRRLAKHHNPAVVTALGVGGLLDTLGYDRAANDRPDVSRNSGNWVELDWWQSVEVNPRVKIHAVPAQHFSGRGPFDRNQTLWCGFVVEAPSGPIFFAGDTGHGEIFDTIAQKFSAPRLAIIPIGAYRPRWVMASVHIAPVEAVRIHETLRARTSIASHWGTFQLTDDGMDEPRDELERILAARDNKLDFRTLEHGVGVEV